MLSLHSFSKDCAWLIASECIVNVFSILSSRVQIFAMELLSFFILLVNSLVVVSEPGALEPAATDAHV